MAESKLTPRDDMIKCKLLSGKFSIGRHEERKVYRAGDIVSLTPIQFKNFGDLVVKVEPKEAEKAVKAA